MSPAPILRAAFAAALALASPGAPALEILHEGERLFLSGGITPDDWVKYRETTRDLRFREVVLVNSPGGNIDTALFIARDVEARGADTVLAGFCNSACTYIYVAGRKRRVSSAWPPQRTRLGIHGTYDTVFGMVARDGPRVFAHYKKHLGDQWDPDLISRAIYGSGERDAMMNFYHPASYKGVPVQFCRGGGRPCEDIPGKDGHALGMFTSLELVPVDLPPSLRRKREAFGIDLDTLRELAAPEWKATLCEGRGADCGTLVDRYAARGNERALALSRSRRPGMSWSYAQPEAAARRALFECTTRSAEPCQLVALSDHSPAIVYERFEAETQAALPALHRFAAANPPASPPSGMAGAARAVEVAEVIALLIDARPPLVLDVACSGRTLPGAQCIIGAGQAMADAQAEAQLLAAFGKLMTSLLPDRTSPVLVVTEGPEDGRAAQAASRLERLGFTKVLWYRGGLAQWREAGLPDVQAAPIASLLR